MIRLLLFLVAVGLLFVFVVQALTAVDSGHFIESWAWVFGVWGTALVMNLLAEV